MTAVDTNLLIRVFTEDDPRQAGVAEAILLRRNIWVAKTVLLETEWVLRSAFEFSPAAIHEAFSRLLGAPNVVVENPDQVASAMGWFAAGMDFADALHLASTPQGANFVTFDRHLVRHADRHEIAGVSLAQ